MPKRKSRIFSTEDARSLAKKRLPRLVFDYVDGAAGREVGITRNLSAFDEIKLQPRVMAGISTGSLKTTVLGREYGLPFGIAPMGMCNLVRPNADKFLANAAKELDFPVCLSSAASSSIEDMAVWGGKRTWFQLYFGASIEASLAMVERARKAGYDTLILTVDVPQVARRVRDLRNGFAVPFSMTPRAFWDFATHPFWSLRTLAKGVPRPRNFVTSDGRIEFDRGASRTGANWKFLRILRDAWPGKLIVKGVTSVDDARRIVSLGADAIYVSNHGGRQLDSVPPAIQLLPLIRGSVGPEIPLFFDSGIRNGEDIVKALALGADFVMLGRPALFALGAEGAVGLHALLNCIVEDIRGVLAQVAVASVAELSSDILFASPEVGKGDIRVAPRVATMTSGEIRK